VNEVKNPPKTQAQDTLTIDTNFLHQFNYVRITFFGSEYYQCLKCQSLPPPADTILQNNYIVPTNPASYMSTAGTPTILSPIQWKGYSFQCEEHVDTPGYYYTYDQSVHGKISDNGISIDSVADNFSAHTYIVMRTQFQDTRDFVSLSAFGIPFNAKNQDSISFSFSGETLENKISKIQDTHYGEEEGAIGPGAINYTLSSVAWKVGTPILTVTFYK
jgi:hypothetical protein